MPVVKGEQETYYTMETTTGGTTYTYRRTFDQLPHGTLNCYNKWGCRCTACIEGFRAWRKDYMWRKHVD